MFNGKTAENQDLYRKLQSTCVHLVFSERARDGSSGTCTPAGEPIQTDTLFNIDWENQNVLSWTNEHLNTHKLVCTWEDLGNTLIDFCIDEVSEVWRRNTQEPKEKPTKVLTVGCQNLPNLGTE
jgi:hypothetical protein